MSLEIMYENHAEGLDLEDRKREIEHLLKNHICEVTFTKVDGTLRTLRCTTDGSKCNWQPKPPTPKKITKTADTVITEWQDQPPARKKPENNISVWSLENEAWRSFKVANVVHVKVVQDE